MSGGSEHGGLCTTCENDATCTFPRTPGRPVLQCEELTVGEPSAAVGLRPSADRKEPPDRPIGLCGNCDDVGTCTFPSARQGVLHCEEHK